MSRYPEFDPSHLRTLSARERPSKVEWRDFALPPQPGLSFRDFWNLLPFQLAGETLREVVKAVVSARLKGKGVVWAMGAHPVKVGLSPVLITLMEEGFITALATHGAGAIHDVEIALFGRTSEEVEAGLAEGTFGMARDTADFLNGAADRAMRENLGLGEALGLALLEHSAPYAHLSLFAQAYQKGIPATVHVALGTDIVHMHSSAKGASIGESSLRDFRIFTSVLQEINGGGVLFNVGSAVLMPEVILKAMAILANQGLLRDFTAVNLDFLQHYRPTQQVVRRVSQLQGRGYALTGHHEIMLPLLAEAILEAFWTHKKREEAEGGMQTSFFAPSKIGDWEKTKSYVRALQERGQKVVFTNGCFDLLHIGHLRYLEKARSLGDALVVGVNSDASVRRLKGPGRPFVPQEERMELLAGFSCVNRVTLFDQDTPEELIHYLRPDIHCKGGDYRLEDLPEAKVVQEYGGQIVILPLLPAHSSSLLAERVNRAVRQSEKQ